MNKRGTNKKLANKKAMDKSEESLFDIGYYSQIQESLPSPKSLSSKNKKVSGSTDTVLAPRPKRPMKKSTSQESITSMRSFDQEDSNLRPKRPMKKSTSQESITSMRSFDQEDSNLRPKRPMKKSTSQESITSMRSFDQEDSNLRPKRPMKKSTSQESIMSMRSFDQGSENYDSQSTCKDLEQLIYSYSVETGNEEKRIEIFVKIMSAWQDIKKDLFCLDKIKKNKVEIPKNLRVFFGLEEPYSMKKSSTQPAKSSVAYSVIKKKFTK